MPRAAHAALLRARRSLRCAALRGQLLPDRGAHRHRERGLCRTAAEALSEGVQRSLRRAGERQQKHFPHHGRAEARRHFRDARLRSRPALRAARQLRAAGGGVLPRVVPARGLSCGRQRDRSAQALPSRACHAAFAGGARGRGAAARHGLRAEKRAAAGQRCDLFQAERPH